MKILIVGSKGFVGSHVLTFFSSKVGVIAWGCDVMVDYTSENYFLIDASNSNFEDLFQIINFDVCINCSGSASVIDSFKNPSRDYFLNVSNPFKLLEGIRKYSPHCKFLNLSSAAVYGNPASLPISEEQMISPLSPYGWHKYQAELLCKEYYLVHGIRTANARVFSAFGIGLKKQLFWDWAHKISASKNIVLYGTGNESRDFIFIDDLVHALICIIENCSFEADVINVANGKEIYIKDAIEVFKSEIGIEFDYYFDNQTRAGDPINWVANIDTLNSLGYKQNVSFEMGIKQLCKWLKEEKK